ncbi:MAG: 4-(cytidine 5'-diphospho)-2-C-methyl-D-erythritol kinase [Opitutaceae bacterium]
MAVLSIFAPAKLNLYLAVTARRPDGFHDLVSIVTPLAFGDTLQTDTADVNEKPGTFSLTCDDPALPCDETNLVLKAARAFAATTGWPGRASFHLEKRIPIGAGLGGGSSNAAAALKALNHLAGPRFALGAEALSQLAAQVGSDCPLFLCDGAIVMRGRGDRVEPFPAKAAARLQGRRVLVFKPAFGIATPWAYAQIAAGAPASYLPLDLAESRIADWSSNFTTPLEDLLFNNLEPAAFAKFVALPVLRKQMRSTFGLKPRMSGSGSACFALLNDDSDVTAITAAIRAAWGDSAFVVTTRLASGA